MAVHLNTIPAQAGEVLRALIEVASGSDANAWWLDARADPATQGAVVAGSMAVVGGGSGAITRWRYRWGGANNILLNKSGGGGDMASWVGSGGILHSKFLLIASDDTSPDIDVQIAFRDFTAAGGSYCRIPITSADIVKLARLTNNFNLLNLVISDEPGSGPVPPPPVTRDTSGDVAAGAPVVSAGAEAVPAAVRDTDAAIAAGAPGVDVDAARVEPGDADTSGDVRAGAPRVSADAEVVPAGDSDTAATAGAGAPVLTAGVETVGVQPPSDAGGDLAAGAPEVDATARVVAVPSETNVQLAWLAAGAWMPRTNPPRAVMPLVVRCEGATEDLCPAICRELVKKLEWCIFGETAIPSDSAPHGVITSSSAQHVIGGVVVSLDVNQGLPEFEDGDPEPSISDVRILLTQPCTTDADDLPLFISRRADLRRVLSRLHGGIGV